MNQKDSTPALPLPEGASAKIPALVLLTNLGWSFVSPEQAMSLRNHNQGEVVLTEVLRKELAKRRFIFGGKEYPLSDKTIENLIAEVCSPALNEGLLVANEKIYNQLLYGISVAEFIDGKKARSTIALIDWQNIKNNSFIFTEDFFVTRANGAGVARPDIVCFVNGIPFAVIEAKNSDLKANKNSRIHEGISQSLRNQGADEIPHLFAYAQLILSVDATDGRYGTCCAPEKSYSAWHEEDLSEMYFSVFKNRNLSAKQKQQLFNHRSPSCLQFYESLIASAKLPVTGQDRILTGLLSPERLMDITRYFTIFDKRYGHIIAWSHQMVAVNRIVNYLSSQNRFIGDNFVCHAAGSGKSTSLLFLIKSFLLNPALKDYRVILVADRAKLEDQVKTIFTSGIEFLDKRAGESLIAPSGRRLAEQVGKGTERIIYAIAEKFNTAIKLPECSNTSSNIVVLISDGIDISGDIRTPLPNAVSIKFTSRLTWQEIDRRSLIHSYDPQDNSPLLDERDESLDRNSDAELMRDMGFIQYAKATNNSGSSVGIREETGNYQIVIQASDLDEFPDRFNKQFQNNQIKTIFLNALKKVLADQSGEIKSSWIALATEAEKIILDVINSHSISFASAEREIRQRLLPLVFSECKAAGAGMDEARKVINLVIENCS